MQAISQSLNTQTHMHIIMGCYKYNNFDMIPLSSGRSARIDQLYRSMSPAQIDSDKSYESRSIELIRSIGNEVIQSLEKDQWKLDKGRQGSSSTLTKIQSHPSDLQQGQPKNIYDRYKKKQKMLSQQLTHARTSNIVTQLAKTRKQQQAKHSRYQNVGSKLYQQQGRKTLNYEKMSQKKAKQENEIQRQAAESRKQIQRNREYFDKFGKKSAKWASPYALADSVVERGKIMMHKKQENVQKTRIEQSAREIEGATFSPERISRRFKSIESQQFFRRNQSRKAFNLERQKKVIKEELLGQTATPKINQKLNVQSIIKPIWSTNKVNNNRIYRCRADNSSALREPEFDESIIGANKTCIPEQTANTTSQVLLKNLSELSFIFE